jgi:microcystin-dependent protein
MSDPFLAEIRLFTGNFAPFGWALTNGQLLSISQNTAVFSLVGTFYGGDGKTNFALPNFQSRMPVHQGQGIGLSQYFIGQQGGVESLSFSGLPLPSAPSPSVSASVSFRPQTQMVSPFLVLNFIIALQGVFPSRN